MQSKTIETARTIRTMSIFRLREDLKNPDIDRRRGGFYSMVTIPAGTIFYLVKTEYKDGDPTNYSATIDRQTVFSRSLSRALAEFQSKDAVDATTLADFVFLSDCGSYDVVLAFLFKHGKITGEMITCIDSREEFEVDKI